MSVRKTNTPREGDLTVDKINNVKNARELGE